MKTILVSSCLVGINTRYNGKSEDVSSLVRLVREHRAVFVCPEQLGGLSTPRDPAEIEPGKTARDVLLGKGRVLTATGKDVTGQFVEGAKRVLEICRKFGVEIAVLKARSPSCGSLMAYDGTFSYTLIPGRGITAELLSQNGITVYDETNFPPTFLSGP